MPAKINDRTMVYVLFIVLAILSLITVGGNRAASDAAKDAAMAARAAVTSAEAAVKSAQEAVDAATAARDAAIQSDEQVNSHRIQNDAEHKCLLVVTAAGQNSKDVIDRFEACVKEESHGTIDPNPVE